MSRPRFDLRLLLLLAAPCACKDGPGCHNDLDCRAPRICDSVTRTCMDPRQSTSDAKLPDAVTAGDGADATGGTLDGAPESADTLDGSPESADALDSGLSGPFDVGPLDAGPGCMFDPQVRILSRNTHGTVGDQPSHSPALSGDGNVVAFLSRAANLAPWRPSALESLYVEDLRTGIIERIGPIGSTPTAGIDPGNIPSLTQDGRLVTFTGTRGPELYDRFARTHTPLNVAPSGALGNGPGSAAVISADGRFGAFVSNATNLSQKTPTTSRMCSFAICGRARPSGSA